MGARVPLIIVGAILMFVSIMLPTIFFPSVHGSYFGKDVVGIVYYWMAGEVFAWIREEGSLNGGTYTRYSMYNNFRPDAFGLLCMTIVIVGAILALVLGNATETKVAFIGGLLGLIGTIVFYACVAGDIVYTRVHPIVSAGYTPYPFVGFFICIVGGILALVGGTLDKY